MKTSNFYSARSLWLGSVLVLSASVLLSPRLSAQSQDDQSVAEAARKAKEKKKPAPKDNRVITDDTIGLRPASADSGAAPPSGTVINTTPVMPGGASPAAPADAAAAPPAGPAKSTESSAVTDVAAPGAADTKKAEKQAAEIAKLKESLKQMQSELDLLKRKFALDSENFYSQPDYAHDADGKARLDEQQRQIGDKRVSVEDLKHQLEQLIEEAGISSDAADKPAAPPRN